MAKKVIRDERLKLDIVIDGNQAQKELGNLEQESRELQEQIKDLSREINKTKDKDSEVTKALIGNRKDLAKEIEASTDQESLATQEKIARLKELDREISKSKTKDAEATKEMMATRKELNKSLSENREKQALIRKELGLHGMTYRQLGQVAKGLQAQLSNSTYGSEQWKKLDAELRQVKARMTEVRGGAQQTGFSLSKMANGFNKYFTMISTFALSISGLVAGIRKAYLAYAEFDDKLADVMKTTGLTKDEVKALNLEFDKIDTRSSQEELNDLARIAGKLGINASEDVLGFVRAADKINVALSEDLGGNAEDAIREIGKLTDIFKLKETYGMEESLLKVGSTINALGAASTANEAYMVEFTKRLAGVAPNAKISIQNILGLAATLDQLGQSSEVASTVMSQLLPDMFKDTGTYAEMAGMKVDDFAQLLETDANEAMIKVLEGLNGNNEGFGAMVQKLDALGLEGKRSISVLGVLANNTELLRQQQQYSNTEFQKGTSILDEFNTKNQTAKAELDKAVKVIQRMWRELGEKLAPAIRGVISSGTALVKSLTVVVDFFIRFGGVIKVLANGLIAYVVTVKLVNHWTVIVTAAKKAWAFVTGILTGKIKLATVAMQVWNTVMKANPIGLVVGAVTALLTAFALLQKQTDKMTASTRVMGDVNKEATRLLANERVVMNTLLAIARDETKSKEEREAAIRRLNEISPDYLGGLTLETINTNKAKASTEEYIKTLHQLYKVKAAENKLTSLYEQLADHQGPKEKGEGGSNKRIMNYLHGLLLGNFALGEIYNMKDFQDQWGVGIAVQIKTLEEFLAKEKKVEVNVDPVTEVDQTQAVKDLKTLKNEATQLQKKIKDAKNELAKAEKTGVETQTQQARDKLTALEAELNNNLAAQKKFRKTLTEDEKEALKKAQEEKLKELQKQAEEIKKAYENLYDEVAFVELTEYDRSIALLDKKLQEQQQIIEKARTTMIKGADGKMAPVISDDEAKRSLELIEIQYMEKRMELDQQEFQRMITTTTQKVQKEEEYQVQVQRLKEQYVERNSELITYEMTLLEEQHRKGIVSTEQYTQRLAELTVQKNNISLQFEKQVAQEQLKHITALHSQKLMATTEFTSESIELNRRIEEIQIAMLDETSRKQLETLQQRHTSNLISETEFINQKRSILESSSAAQTSILTQAQTNEMNALVQRRTSQIITEAQYVQEMKVLLSSVTDTQISMLSEASRKELEVLNEKHINNLISETEFINQKRSILESSSTMQTSIEVSLNKQLQSLRRTNSEEGMAVLKSELTELYTVYAQKKNEVLMSDEEYARRSQEITTNTQKLTTEQVTEQLKALNDERTTRAQNALFIEEEYRQKKQEIINKAVQDDAEVKAEKERLEKLAALRNQYGLQTNAELMKEELDQLKKHYQEMELTDAEYAKARGEIIKKHTKQEAPEQDKLTGGNAMANLNAWFATESAALQQQYANKLNMEDAYQAARTELEKVHEEARKDIRGKAIEATLSTTANMFGTIAGFFEEGSLEYKLFASFQVTLDTIQAAMAAYKATIGIPVVGPALAPVAAATAAAFGIAQIAKINATEVPQYYTGYYDVVGERDGKRYQAKYQGKPKTGYVSTPSLYLAGDDPHRLKEMIVSGPDLQNPMIADYARAIMDIKANRQPVFNMPADVQFTRSAAGQQAQGSGGGSNSMFGVSEMLTVLQSMNNKLDKLDNPTRAYMVYSEFERAKQKIEDIQNDVRRS